MDVYLGCEARKYLEGLALSRNCLEGILIGHKRGFEFYIERVFPFHKALSMTEERFTEINRHFDDKVVGFYTFSTEEKSAEKIFVPFAVGKVLVKISENREKDPLVRSFFIDYEDTFSLRPIDTHTMNRE